MWSQSCVWEPLAYSDHYKRIVLTLIFCFIVSIFEVYVQVVMFSTHECINVLLLHICWVSDSKHILKQALVTRISLPRNLLVKVQCRLWQICLCHGINNRLHSYPILHLTGNKFHHFIKWLKNQLWWLSSLAHQPNASA